MIAIDTTETAARRKHFLRQVNILRFVVPFILFAVVLSYEVWEHIWLDGYFSFDPHLTSEVLFFGIIGPAEGVNLWRCVYGDVGSRRAGVIGLVVSIALA